MARGATEVLGDTPLRGELFSFDLLALLLLFDGLLLVFPWALCRVTTSSWR